MIGYYSPPWNSIDESDLHARVPEADERPTIPRVPAYTSVMEGFPHDSMGLSAALRQAQVKIEAPANTSRGMQIRVLGIPTTGAKSRVETQIKLCVQLLSATGDKVSKWDHLVLPEHLVQKDRVKSAPRIDPALARQALYLEAAVVCSSDTSRNVTTCFGCIQRERKRAQRRKEQQAIRQAGGASSAPAGPVSPLSPQSPPVGAGAGADAEVPDASSTDNVQLEQLKILVFNCNRVVDFASGDTIIPTRITCYCRHHNEKTGFCIAFVMRDHAGEVIASGLSPPIMITDDHKSAKARSAKRPRSDSMSGPAGDAASLAAGEYYLDNSMSAEQFVGEDDMDAEFDPIESFFKYPASEAAGVPLTMPKEEPLDYEQLVHASASPSNVQAEFRPRPQIVRLVPGDGPVHGGVEVTLLGSDFYEGATVMFGLNEARPTHFWSPSTLVCVLPPAAAAGVVPVTILPPANIVHEPVVAGVLPDATFTYRDVADRALMEMALQLVGMKFTGKISDAKNIALAIVNMSQQSPGATQGGAEQQGSMQQQGGMSLSECESVIVAAISSAFEADDAEAAMLLSLSTLSSRHTLLHLAVTCGLERLVEVLLERLPVEALDAQDANGMTALHIAAWRGDARAVGRLIAAGADMFAANAWRMSAADVARPTLRALMLRAHNTALDASDDIDVDIDFDIEAGEAVAAAAEDEEAELVRSMSISREPSVSAIPVAPLAQTTVQPEAPVAPAPEPLTNAPPQADKFASARVVTDKMMAQVATFFPQLKRGGLQVGTNGEGATGVVRHVEKKRRRKRDRMLFNFWIPLVLVMAALACFQFINAQPERIEMLQSFAGFAV